MKSAFDEFKPGPRWKLYIGVSFAYIPRDFPVADPVDQGGDYNEDQAEHFILDERWLQVLGGRVTGGGFSIDQKGIPVEPANTCSEAAVGRRGWRVLRSTDFWSRERDPQLQSAWNEIALRRVNPELPKGVRVSGAQLARCWKMFTFRHPTKTGAEESVALIEPTETNEMELQCLGKVVVHMYAMWEPPKGENEDQPVCLDDLDMLFALTILPTKRLK